MEIEVLLSLIFLRFVQVQSMRLLGRWVNSDSRHHEHISANVARNGDWYQ